MPIRLLAPLARLELPRVVETSTTGLESLRPRVMQQPSALWEITSRSELAGQEGFEPPTFGFGDRRSTSSSYWPVGMLTTAFSSDRPLARPAKTRRQLVDAYSLISVTVPAPTVRPPSRMANRTPFSIAIGAISSTSRFTLSPGITISVPSGSSEEPVTSVVRK